MNAFAVRLRSIRKRRKLTQRQLASKLNISQSTIALYETGDRKPDPETINKIADFFNVSTDYLLGRTDDPNPNKEEEVDIKKILEQKKKAHWDGRELTEEERRYLSRLIRVAIQRDEEAATKESD